MQLSYSTRDLVPAQRRTAWQKAIASVYFPLDLVFQGSRQGSGVFEGSLEAWTLGSVSISRNCSNGLLYRRHEQHLVEECDESYLITVPELAEVRFLQDGQDVSCQPGGFLIERSHLPYEFSHRDPASLWVLKVPKAVLENRISRPERLASLRFDARTGAGALFVDMLRLSVARITEFDATAQQLIGCQLVELLAAAVSSDSRVLTGSSTTVRHAHLCRAEDIIRSRLRDPALTPQSVADACGISLRYLQQIFEEEDTTVGTQIRTQRLMQCDQRLRDPHFRGSISQIAYACGFGDQAQFSRSYRAHFGRTPSDTRAEARRNH
ncbi:helix-turn-helix domain-containing protein [Jiella sp. MQZ9-1]|uniref:Helix-turn-helix domain-containing protein n=1 Tax=Jiella flava TaxID=2816857 RepID=A0A939FX43_9HYPH|nr:helix-turn-helix domain-containing protein [Jiella flava]MBO0663117.1 helix-turn-helix domain-containing protein [Jiella flava]MCD2471536.1 helix-turn-helix domain-containing protein [Jiella flava]